MRKADFQQNRGNKLFVLIAH